MSLTQPHSVPATPLPHVDVPPSSAAVTLPSQTQILWTLLKEMKLDLLKGVGVLVTVPGGLLFIIYYYHIGYLPTLGLGDLLGVFATLAITSVFSYAVLSFGLVGAGFLWSVIMLDVKSLAGLWDRDGVRRPWPALLLYVSHGFIVTAALASGEWLSAPVGWTVWGLGSLALGVVVAHIAQPINDSPSRLTGAWPGRIGVAVGCVTFSNLVLLPEFFATELIFQLLGVPSSDPAVQALCGYGSFLFAVLLNGLIASMPRKNLKRQLLAGAACLGVLLTGSMSWHFIPAFVFQAYGWGNRENVTLLLDRAGCEIVSGYQLDVQIFPAAHQHVRCGLFGVTVLNALGKEYSLRFIRPTQRSTRREGGGDTIQFTLPATSIFSAGHVRFPSR